jgi:hypothetical protein
MDYFLSAAMRLILAASQPPNKHHIYLIGQMAQLLHSRENPDLSVPIFARVAYIFEDFLLLLRLQRDHSSPGIPSHVVLFIYAYDSRAPLPNSPNY